MKVIIIALTLLLASCSYSTNLAVGKYGFRHSVTVNEHYP